MRKPPRTQRRPTALAEPSRARALAGTAALVLMPLIAYVPAYRALYVWDDDFYLTQNPVVRSPSGLADSWLHPTANPQYYPLVFTAFWVESRLWGLDPVGFHVVNVLLHAASTVVLWRILRRLGLPGAWLAAAIFALHPVNVESVAWITERKNVLSGLFYLLALSAYLRFEPLDVASPVRRWGWYAVSLACFALALTAKTVTCSLPAAIVLLIWWKRDRLQVREILPLIPFFLLGLLMAFLTAWVERHHVGAGDINLSLTPAARCVLAGQALLFYLWKLLIPFPLIFIYPRWTINTANPIQWIPSLVVLAALMTLFLLRRRIGRGPLVAALLYAGTLLPALGFIDVYPMLYSWVADHFQYLAMIPVITALVVALARVTRVHTIGAIAGATALVAALSVLTWHSATRFRDETVLWQDTLARNPSAWIAYHNLGAQLLDRGEYEAARPYFETTLRLNPRFSRALSNLAIIEAMRGDLARAVAYCNEAIAINDYGRIEAYTNLGRIYFLQGRNKEAIEQLQKAVELDPKYVLAHINLCDVFLATGRRADAIRELREVLKYDPDNAEARRLLGGVESPGS